MDVLSSQANLAGYRAVFVGSRCLWPQFPYDDDGSGHDSTSQTDGYGCGSCWFAGDCNSQAFSVIVSATDVRPAAKEQVESLGASFVAVMDEEFKAAESAAGYAKQMSQADPEKQQP